MTPEQIVLFMRQQDDEEDKFRVVLQAIKDGEVVDGYCYTYGLKPEFEKFMEA